MFGTCDKIKIHKIDDSFRRILSYYIIVIGTFLNFKQVESGVVILRV